MNFPWLPHHDLDSMSQLLSIVDLWHLEVHRFSNFSLSLLVSSSWLPQCDLGSMTQILSTITFWHLELHLHSNFSLSILTNFPWLPQYDLGPMSQLLSIVVFWYIYARTLVRASQQNSMATLVYLGLHLTTLVKCIVLPLLCTSVNKLYFEHSSNYVPTLEQLVPS